MKIIPNLLVVGSILSSLVSATGQHSAHAGNPFKASEHEALLNLVPVSQATTTAIKTGNWSSPATWSGGIPNANAKVLIPSGITVTYDVNDAIGNSSLRWVRVDGVMRFSTISTTRMLVDTIAITPVGSLQMGTDAEPIPSSVSATVLFTDTGALNLAEDPYLIGRGLISHGSASIVGSAKTAYVPVGSIPLGATSVSLNSTPINWAVGDTILINGTQLLRSGYMRTAYEDEVRTIQSISGNTLTFSEPLQYGHVLPGGSPVPLYNYISNLSRNITFSSENTNMGVDYRNAQGTDTQNLSPTLVSQNANIQRRGHVMFMHSTSVLVKYASFNDLGRSNKDLYVDDVPSSPMKVWERWVDDDGVEHPEGSTIVGAGTNPRGRYSVHFHLCGSKDVNAADGSGPQYTYNNPVICEGVVSRNSPGWAFSNHDSYVKFLDCIAYNSYGSGFVEESGNGIGEFRRCMSVRNGHNNVNWTAGDWRELLSLLDLGRSGHGFFYRGNMVETYDCVSASCDSSGFAWNGKHGAGGSRVPAQNLPYPAITNGADYMQWEATPYTNFHNNTAYSTVIGIHAFYSSPLGDGRSVIENTLLWNILEGGIVANYGGYSGQITVTGLTCLADPNEYDPEVHLFAPWSRGLEVSLTFNDIVWDNCYVKGFYYGVFTQNEGDGVKRIQLIDNCDLTNNTIPVGDTKNPVIHYASPANRDTLSFTPQSPTSYQQVIEQFNLEGTKVDPLGSDVTAFDPNYEAQFTNRFRFERVDLRSHLADGYFTDLNGNYLVLPYAITNRLTGAVKTLYHKLYTDIAENQNRGILVGPNLGSFIDPGATKVPAPHFSIPAGSYTTPQTLKIVNPLQGTFYYYTTDGSTPARASDGRPAGTSRLYSSPIELPAGNSNFRVVAHAGSMTPSDVVSVTYNSNVNPQATDPILSLPGGVYATPQSVAITTATSGVNIRYTLNGQIPTSSNGSIYSGPVIVPVNTTLKAISYGSGFLDSKVKSARYTLAPEVMVMYSYGDSFAAGVTGNDLLQTDASLLSSGGMFTQYSSYGIPALTNGSASNFASARAGIGSNSFLVYSLDTIAHPNGYDITAVDIFTGGNDSQRNNPNVTVSYSLVGNATAFFPIATANYFAPQLDGISPWTKSAIHYMDGSPLMIGVAAIRFDFGEQFIGGQAVEGTDYTELDVIGLPTSLVPYAPSDLAATAAPDQVKLSWHDQAYNETGYQIYRSPNGYAGWTQIGTTAANGMSFVDNSILPETTYFYQVSAANSAGNSDYSEIANAVTLPATTLPSGIVSFRAANGLDADGTQDSISSAGDGIANLLKYAFNMIGTGPGQVANIITPDMATLSTTGNAGMPFVGIESLTGKLQVTYLRRLTLATPASGIIYEVQFSNSLNDWATNSSAVETTSNVDAMFERVTMTDSAAFPTKRFVRVKVSAPKQ